MSQYTLAAQKRTILGKKVKRLRREGQVPAIVYGPNSDPVAIQTERRELRQVLSKAGGTQLIELQVDSERVAVLAREVQRNPVRGEILHVDFYRVALDRPIRAEVPVHVINEPAIVSSGGAMVHQVLNSLEVEALPTSLPPYIEVDISVLQAVGDNVLGGHLDLGEAVRILEGPDEIIVRLTHVRQIIEEVEEELLAPEEAAVEPEVIRERKPEEEAEAE